MRTQPRLRVRPPHLAAGALAIASTLSATALALAADDGPVARAPASAAAPAPPPSARVADRTLRYGERVVVRGRVAAGRHGRRVALQHKPAGRRWRVVQTARARPGGRYELAATARTSGKVRVAAVEAVANAAAERPAVSRAHRVSVAGRLVVRRRSHGTRLGGAVRVRGVLFPRARGTKVAVEGRVGGRWRAVARARTRANGHFGARVEAQRLGAMPLRVRAAATRRNGAARAAAGSLKGFRAGLASWYWLYGSPLACGGTLGYSQLGVAHKTLPCGTKVTIRHNGRQVTVPVIDRGPYVGGREWDLTGATARRLGFNGVGTVWTTA